MKTIYFLTFVLFLVVGSVASAQIAKPNGAKIGYVYPAGGQRGSTFDVFVGGRQISRAVGAAFSGGGISVKVLDTFPWPRNLDGRDRYEIRNRVVEVASKHISDTPEGKAMKTLIERLPKANKPNDPPEEIEAIPFVWPRYASLRKIAEPDVFLPFDETLDLIYQNYGPNMWRRAPDPLMEIVLLEVTIAPDAVPGNRELRLITNLGISNPMYFQVGVHPEVVEKEPNSPDNNYIANTMRDFPQPVYETPVVINGQILHADVDRFRFRAKKGETLVLNVQARQLMPYLADAVPGWFEAVVTVYDEKENEIGYADGYRFEQDPVYVFTAPEDGVYIAEVRDSLFRGREDFVYRLSIARTPLVESVFPLGLKEGTTATLKLEGINLPKKEIQVEAKPGHENIREISMIDGHWLPFPVRYAVDSLPEANKTSDNNSREKAQAVALPVNVNGILSQPGEHDFYRFEGKEGETIVFEVIARKLNSPLDSRITLLDEAGQILAENDDGGTIDPDAKYMSYLIGTQTHNADSKLTHVLPKTGNYVVRIGDAARQGGAAFSYRLRVSRPRPDFTVYTTPTSVLMPTTHCAPIWFRAIRGEGYTGPIELKLVGDPNGFSLDGGLFQEGEDEMVCILTTPPDPLNHPFALTFEAVAIQDGETVRRPVFAAEDMEQAFLYHHLVPADHFWVLLNTRQATTGFRPLKTEPIVLKQGQAVDVEFESPNPNVTATTIYFLKDAPPGIWVKKKEQEKNRLVLTIGAAADTLQKTAEKEFFKKNPPPPPQSSNAEAGKEPEKPAVEPLKTLAGNLFVSVDAETVPKNPNDKKTRYSLGGLPALPFRVVP